MLIRITLRFIVSFGVLAAILFALAGRADLPMFWAYIVVLIVPSLIAAVQIYRHSPDLFSEHLQPDKASQDRLGVPAAVILFLAHIIIAAFDVGRYHWSDSVPFILQIVGLVGFGFGISLLAWSMTINRFFSNAIRIQDDRGQKVIAEGPYQFVRHPGYIAELMLLIFSGIALGSWLSVLPLLLLAAVLLRRTRIEDAMLQKDLPGYSNYAHNVPYRLIPGVW